MTTALLMEFEGADGSTTFVDDSGLTKTISVFGAAAISTDHALYGAGSVELLNLGDYLRIEHSGASELTTTSNWSLHLAYRRADVSANRTLLSTVDDRISIRSDGGGSNMQCRISDGINVTNPSWSAPALSWDTVGISCQDGELRLLAGGLIRHIRAFVGGVNFNNMGLGRYVSGAFNQGHFGGWVDKLYIDRTVGLWRWKYDPMTLVPDDTLITALIDRDARAQGHVLAWPTIPRVVSRQHRLRRVDYGGLGKVCGTVKIKGLPDAPVRRIVRLVRELDAVTVAEQWSDPVTGEYEFTGFDPGQKYTVLAYDLAGGFRAAIASGVSPVPMTV